MGSSDMIPASGCFEGHERAFRRVFARHYGAVGRLLMQITRDRAEAEDLAQEVFVSLLHHRFAPGRSHDVRRWLLRVALNRGLNGLRSARRRGNRERLRAPDAGAYDLESAVQRRQVQQHVRATLAGLEPRAAKLLMLRQLGLSYGELAEVIDVAPGSIGTLLVRAQRAFVNAHTGRLEAREGTGVHDGG